VRLVITAVIWVALLGGLSLYMHGREPAVAVEEFTFREAEGSYSIDVTTGFAVEPDPFALQAEEGAQPAALTVQVNGEQILRETERVPQGAPIRVEDVTGLIAGVNEFYVEANPPLDASQQAHALRIRVLRDGTPLAERTFWSEPGGRIAETFELTVETAQGPGAGGDDHHGQ
jgi:hypothetical protein